MVRCLRFYLWLFYLPNNFIVSGVKTLRLRPVLILNVILFSILLTYILIDGILIFSSCFLKYTQNNLESDTEYDPSGNSNVSFHVGTHILNSLLLYELFMFFHVQ